MKTQIGHLAGKIWETLDSKGSVSITQLPKILDEKSVLVYQALGWLAREEKIIYKKEKNKVIVSLSDKK